MCICIIIFHMSKFSANKRIILYLVLPYSHCLTHGETRVLRFVYVMINEEKAQFYAGHKYGTPVKNTRKKRSL